MSEQQVVTVPYETPNVILQSDSPEVGEAPGWGWGWVIAIVIIILIILIIVAIAAWQNKSDDDECVKPARDYPRPRPKPTPPSPTPSSRTVALLDLTGNGTVNTDRDIAAVLEVYNSEREPDQQVIIKDTQSNIERTAALWEESIAEGNLKFIGGSSSNVLTALKPAINNRPDTVFVSVASTAPSLAAPDNIYRLIKDDTNMIPSIPEFIARKHNYVHILEQEGSIWAKELSQLMQESLRQQGVTVAVTKVYGPLLGLNMDADQNGNRLTTAEGLNDELSNCIPHDVDPAFLDIFEEDIAQYIFEQIDDASWASYKHYGFGSIAFFPFSGKAADAARRTELQVFSYYPQGTIESESIKLKTGRKNLNPVALSAYDAAVSLERVGNDLTELPQYYNSNRGVTGLLTVNNNGDRITSSYMLWNYNDGDWSSDLLFGRAIPYGDYIGRFNVIDNNNSPYCDTSYRDNSCSDYSDHSARYEDQSSRNYSPRSSLHCYFSPRSSLHWKYSPRSSSHRNYSPRYDDYGKYQDVSHDDHSESSYDSRRYSSSPCHDNYSSQSYRNDDRSYGLEEYSH